MPDQIADQLRSMREYDAWVEAFESDFWYSAPVDETGDPEPEANTDNTPWDGFLRSATGKVVRPSWAE